MFSRYTVFIGLALIVVVLLTDSAKADQEDRNKTCRRLVKAHIDYRAIDILLEDAIALCNDYCLKEEATEEENIACLKEHLRRN